LCSCEKGGADPWADPLVRHSPDAQVDDVERVEAEIAEIVVNAIDEMQVALAWLLHRSPNILLIPGTSSTAHLRENLQAAALQLPPEILARLDSIAAARV